MQASNADELVTSAQLKIAAAFMVISYDPDSGMVSFFTMNPRKQREIARTIKRVVDDLLRTLVGMPGITILILLSLTLI